ncbi:MAG: hypothetical protein AB1668_01365 [Nanoarchaeota archaeon]
MARKGVCQGFHDSGDFFKNERVKRQFEGKIPLTEFDTEVEGFRIGVNEHIFQKSDLIEV